MKLEDVVPEARRYPCLKFKIVFQGVDVFGTLKDLFDHVDYDTLINMEFQIVIATVQYTTESPRDLGELQAEVEDQYYEAAAKRGW